MCKPHLRTTSHLLMSFVTSISPGLRHGNVRSRALGWPGCRGHTHCPSMSETLHSVPDQFGCKFHQRRPRTTCVSDWVSALDTLHAIILISSISLLFFIHPDALAAIFWGLFGPSSRNPLPKSHSAAVHIHHRLARSWLGLTSCPRGLVQWPEAFLTRTPTRTNATPASTSQKQGVTYSSHSSVVVQLQGKIRLWPSFGFLRAQLKFTPSNIHPIPKTLPWLAKALPFGSTS